MKEQESVCWGVRRHRQVHKRGVKHSVFDGEHDGRAFVAQRAGDFDGGAVGQRGFPHHSHNRPRVFPAVSGVKNDGDIGERTHFDWRRNNWRRRETMLAAACQQKRQTNGGDASHCSERVFCLIYFPGKHSHSINQGKKPGFLVTKSRAFCT